MKSGKWFLSTGLRGTHGKGYWHLLIALHASWRVAFVKPDAKPNYRRLFFGPIEIEWSYPT